MIKNDLTEKENKIFEQSVENIKSGRWTCNGYWLDNLNRLNDRTRCYQKWYADSVLRVACETLTCVGFCNRDCDACKLTHAHKNAIDEIDKELRAPVKRNTRHKYDDCKMSVTKTKSGKTVITFTIN